MLRIPFRYFAVLDDSKITHFPRNLEQTWLSLFMLSWRTKRKKYGIEYTHNKCDLIQTVLQINVFAVTHQYTFGSRETYFFVCMYFSLFKTVKNHNYKKIN